MVTKYKHLFFDLDRTLYDFENNNRQTLIDLFNSYLLHEKGIKDFDTFFQTYSIINLDLWEQYKKKEITSEFLNTSRFQKTFGKFNLCQSMATAFASEYLTNSPLQTKVLPGTFEVLEYLKPKYSLHIITNGFEKLQFEKLKRCNIHDFFSSIITSEKAGALKPDKQIFRHAMQQTGASPAESLIIGDDPKADILGGINFGIDQVWLAKPGEISDYKPTFKINGLPELMTFL